MQQEAAKLQGVVHRPKVLGAGAQEAAKLQGVVHLAKVLGAGVQQKVELQRRLRAKVLCAGGQLQLPIMERAGMGIPRSCPSAPREADRKEAVEQRLQSVCDLLPKQARQWRSLLRRLDESKQL